ncbi:hypothetical protein [Pleionea sp. CnH1-48]|uniref:hypothetical protein n=1 Tax=Pleionea sp. CnH1-48 TaxID=2954494 RepID=UPI002096C47D|nr:hypothetical protein [Pleionea sp. CnH1-48]MCO7226838.1 hypothetical protein [Pleionea sp. CnH1-48]
MFYFGRVEFPWPLLLVVATIAVAALFYHQLPAYRMSDSKRYRFAFIATSFTNLAPVLSLIVSLWVFTFAQSHPTAQISGAGGSWGVWTMFWPLSLLAHLVGGVAILVSLILEYHWLKHKFFFLYRLLSLGLLLLSFSCVMGNFPDA